MSAARRNKSALGRSHRNIPQRKLFIIVGEGEVTEREYVKRFISDAYATVYKSPRGSHGGDAKRLVRQMREERKKHSPSTKAAPTEYWIIADAEEENKNHNLEPLFDWVQEDENNHLAITYPQFENWILLHYRTSMSSTNPVHDLAKYIPGYANHNKSIGNRITDEQIHTALRNARIAGVVVTDRPTNMSQLSQGRAYFTSMPHLVQQLLNV